MGTRKTQNVTPGAGVKGYENTHELDKTCVVSGTTVLGEVDGRQWVGVSFAPGGWRPARLARPGEGWRLWRKIVREEQVAQRLLHSFPIGWPWFEERNVVSVDFLSWLLATFHDGDKKAFYGMCYGSSGMRERWLEFAELMLMGGEL